ncbi:hypothetical protein [Paraburkholderia translucens]|uniref:hypothetical protein n=1 Tax=Paraburkholderia translucens TaxID=2886945 RepID=UPI002E760E4D|nr:hypothetical protein [Paraburkholderia sp. MMS20-SJTN17]
MDPELRMAAERVLRKNESLTEFIEAAVREGIVVFIALVMGMPAGQLTARLWPGTAPHGQRRFGLLRRRSGLEGCPEHSTKGGAHGESVLQRGNDSGCSSPLAEQVYAFTR